MTAYLDVVRQVARHRPDLPVAYGARHHFRVGRIAAGQHVPSEKEHVACS